ncbi:MAG: nitrophenyl compound nitroreductase subunit ArsF family protein [archaeon]
MDNKEEKVANCSWSCKMNKMLFYGFIAVAIIMLLFFTIPKYFTGNVTASGAQISGDIEKVEVYHFHATRQCVTCKTVGANAEATVNTYFANELKSGKLIFAHVNVDLPENKALVDKYEAKGSSLLIGVTGKDSSFTKQEDTNVWYKMDKTDSMNYLKGVIEQKFSGL